MARRVGAEWVAALRSFVRKPAAVFFTFVFPLILIGIFGAVIQTGTGGGGLFSQPQGYYVPGYLAVVVVLTPLSRIGTTVARHRSNNRFDKLSTTPLRPSEWLAAHVLVNAVLIGVASILILGFILVTGAEFYPSPLVALFVGLGVVTFCGIGAVLGRVTSSEDGVIAASNAVGIPVLFL
ncbi:MAG: ABC transporter permease, partial [Halobacteria archaeon]|nr:ABC transporter permease [Halobacteria archaeon]